MQIRADQSHCPQCKAARLEFFPILHHMVCAFVGPSYDFIEQTAGYTCPKCQREILSGDETCEIVGASARCPTCFEEMVVLPTTGAPDSS